MNAKVAQLLSSMIELLPLTIAGGLITALLGAGLLGGQYAALSAPPTPFVPALILGGVLLLLGLTIIAAPLIRLYRTPAQAAGEQPDGKQAGS